MAGIGIGAHANGVVMSISGGARPMRPAGVSAGKRGTEEEASAVPAAVVAAIGMGLGASSAFEAASVGVEAVAADRTTRRRFSCEPVFTAALLLASPPPNPGKKAIIGCGTVVGGLTVSAVGPNGVNASLAMAICGGEEV